jgi:hypothetical protein
LWWEILILLIVVVLKLMMNAEDRMSLFLVAGFVLRVVGIEEVLEHVGVSGGGFGQMMGRGLVGFWRRVVG